MIKNSLAIFLFCVFAHSAAQAALITVTDRASFLAATDSVSVIDFAGIAPDGGSVTTDSLTVSGIKFDANVAGGNTLFVLDDTFCCNAYSGRGDNVASLASGASFTSTNNPFINITLPGGITAVGMDLFSVTVGNDAGTIVDTININIAGGTSQIGTVPAVGGGINDQGRVFIGFISDIPLDFLAVYPTALNTAVDIVDFTFGTAGTPNAVPVPAAVWLFGTGLIGLIGFRKRRIAA